KVNLQYPNSYITPPQTSDINLYGVGMGFSHNEAFQNSLANLSSRLLVTISADTTISSNTKTEAKDSQAALNKIDG
ncbi:hypothetical protein ACOL22_13000, partial [Aliarcobacter butzleri]